MGAARSNNFDYILKLVIVGDERVGKSQLIQRLIKKDFSAKYVPTEITDSEKWTLEINKKIVKLQIWDIAGNIAGNEVFKTFRTAYYPGAYGIILLAFDLSESLNIDNLNQHIEEIRCANSNGKIFLVGTKSDLPPAVAQAEIKSFVKEKKLEGYFETSAKNNLGLDQLLSAVVPNLIETLRSQMQASTSTLPIKEREQSSLGFLSRHIGKILVGAVILGAIAALAVFTGGLALTLLPLAKGLIVTGAALVGVVGGVFVGRRKDKQDQEAAFGREVLTAAPILASRSELPTSDFSFNPFKGVSGDLSIPAYAYHITKSEWSSESDNITLQRAGLVDWCTLFLPALILMLLKRTYNVLSQMADNVYKGTLAAAATIFLDVSHWLFPVCLVVLVVGLALSALLKLGSLAVGIGMVPVMLVHSVAALALTAVSLPFVALERSIRACFSSGEPDVGHEGISTYPKKLLRHALPTQKSELKNNKNNDQYENEKEIHQSPSPLFLLPEDKQNTSPEGGGSPPAQHRIGSGNKA